MIERDGIGIRLDQNRFIQQLEDALGSRHRGLQDVEFLAEVLDRPEKALGEHGEGSQNAEAERAGENAVPAGPIDQGDGGEAEKFDRRRKKSLIMVTTPAAKRSLSASTSVVTRVTKRPTGLWSK